MGRYYQGDINGKFVFGSQSSDAADRFGVEGQNPGYLDYCYDTDDLEKLETELKLIESNFGKHKVALKTYYDLYKDEDAIEISFTEYIKIADLPPLTEDQQFEHNDYRIGRKILECIKDQGSCSFTAEL